KIGEEHRDLLLPARARRVAERVRGPGARGQEWRHREVAGRTELAGEAHRGRRAHAPEDAELHDARRWQELGALDDPHAARRAARPTAAHGGVGDPGKAARLED